MGETAARELLLTGALRDVDMGGAPPLRQRGRRRPAASRSASPHGPRASTSVSRAAVARTKAMLNDRFGDLLDAAMAREERACVELFDGPDAPAALQAFARR